MLLEGVFDREQLEAAAAADFELVVHTAEQIELLRSAPPGAQFKVWLKLDSGMNRLGFKGAAFGEACSALSGLPAVQSPVNLFTHLASADDHGTSRRRPNSCARFAEATRSLPGERSIANSAGMLSFPEAQADWVRPGLLLYGVSPFAGSIGADYGLEPAMTLHLARDRRRGSAGERVGYGGDWTAQRPTRLAVAAVGYGRRLPAQPGVRLARTGQRRTRAACRPRIDGHDRDRCHRPCADAAARRPGHPMGRRIAGGRDRGMGAHHSVRTALRISQRVAVTLR